MIRINLLPVKQAKKRGAGQQQLILFAVVLVGLGLLIFTWNRTEREKIKVLEAKQTTIKQEMTRLEELIGDITNIQNKKADLKKKLDIINLLKKEKSGPVRILDELSTQIPKKVWLTNLIESNKTLQMSGYATDNKEIAIFLKNLEASKFFTDVRLIKIEQSSDQKSPIPVMSFQIHCGYTVPQG